MLTTAEITAMRNTQGSALPDAGTVLRYTTAADGMGGVTETWASSGTALCRLSPLRGGGGEAPVSARVTDVDQWIVTFSQGQDVNEKDRIQADGRTFEVIAVSDHATWETARRVWCVEVAGAPEAGLTTPVALGHYWNFSVPGNSFYLGAI